MNQVSSVKKVLKFHHIDKQVKFNEQEFEAYLKSEWMAPPFQLECLRDNAAYKTSFPISKIKTSEQDYYLILKLDTYTKLRASTFKGYSSPDIFGYYSKKANALIAISDYDYGDLPSRCSSLKVVEFDSIVKKFREATELEFEQRYPLLKEKYKSHEEKIQEKYKDFYSEHFTAIVKGKIDEFRKRSYVSLSERGDIKIDYPLMFEYISNPDECVKDFCDRYYATNEGESYVESTVAYYIAMEIRQKEIEQNADVIKAKKVYSLLNEELSEAKNIWLIEQCGRKYQVEKSMSISPYEVTIGTWRKRLKLEEIKSIQYGKMTFDI